MFMLVMWTLLDGDIMIFYYDQISDLIKIFNKFLFNEKIQVDCKFIIRVWSIFLYYF